jgi:hypothetical protein
MDITSYPLGRCTSAWQQLGAFGLPRYSALIILYRFQKKTKRSSFVLRQHGSDNTSDTFTIKQLFTEIIAYSQPLTN